VLVAAGMSALATASHAAQLLGILAPEIRRARLKPGPVCIAPRRRVPLGDGVSVLLGARLVLVMIGERPGLTSPDSLRAYVTIDPRPGRTDTDRN
jgi:ethanolamine ammonia-lyase small subunit